jgi:hypothetical protein
MIHANTKYFTLNASTVSCFEMLWLAELRAVIECQSFPFIYYYEQDSNQVKELKKPIDVVRNICARRIKL